MTEDDNDLLVMNRGIYVMVSPLFRDGDDPTRNYRADIVKFGYKIGQSDDVSSRLFKLRCGNPHLTLLHVIQSSNMDWCEQFLQKRYKRIDREWFDLSWKDLEWLCSKDMLNPPKSIGDQLSLLELL